jgi:sigma-B regulation protein RsbQ
MNTKREILRRNNVNISGRGERPMMFAHGFGCDQHMWRLVAPAFRDSHRLVLFDYVGSGHSDKQAYDDRRYATLHGYAQDVVEICDALDLRDVIFVGHSVSGMIGMLAAIARPECISQLLMVAPSPCYINDPANGYRGGFERGDLMGLLQLMDANGLAWAGFLASMAMANPERPELAMEMEQSFCATDPTIARRFAEATFFSDHRADLARCATPTLVLQCTDDAIAPLGVGDYMQAQLPQGTLVHLPASGHCPHVSHPELTIPALQAYLAR